MRQRIQLFVLSSIFLTACAWAETKIPAPNPLPRVEQEMKTAGFWIARHPSSDEVIMTPDEIAAFNERIREQKLTRDIFKPETFLPDFSPASTFDKALQNIKSDKYFDETGRTATSAFFEPILQNMNTHETFPLEYGLIVRFTNERILPTNDPLYESPGDVEFDQLQNSALEIGTPVVILHHSRDGQWVFAANELTEGWLHADRVAVGDKDIVHDFATSSSFVVTLTPKADIFADPKRTQKIDTVRMGTQLPKCSFAHRCSLIPNHLNQQRVIAIDIPTADESGKLILKSAYMKTSDINEGYLPYNARHILTQAFAMLNQRYGWGGMFGEQDCSKFLQEIFATVGIGLPRNSKEQAQTGLSAAVFDQTTDSDKHSALQKLDPGIYILTLKGHIMFYLGYVDGQPYAIHAIYAYREPTPQGDIAQVINRVAITPLDLGEGSKKGSLLRRLTGIRKIE